MNIKKEFKRDMYHNYMVIMALEENRFEGRMLEENEIKGIMNIQVRSIDNEEYYYYDISSKQPIANLFERGQLGYEQIKSIIGGIINAVEEGSRYLLSEDDFVLDTEYIYITLSSFSVSLCYLPGYNCDIAAQFTQVIEYLMDRADHTDEKAVMLVYSLYKTAKQECTVSSIKEVIEGIDNDMGSRSSFNGVEKDIDICENHVSKKDNSMAFSFEADGAVAESFDAYTGEVEEEIIPDVKSNMDEGLSYKKDNILLLYPAAAAAVILVMAAAYITGILTDADNKIIPVRTVSILLMASSTVGIIIYKLRGMEESGHNDERKNEHKNEYYDELNSSPLERDNEPYFNDNYNYNYNNNYNDNYDDRTDIINKTAIDNVNSINNVNLTNNLNRIDMDDYEEETVLLADYRKKKELFTLVLRDDTKDVTIRINQLPFIVGKLKDKVDYVISDETISRLHAKFDFIDNNQLVLTDLNSKNGTYINGERLLANETRKVNIGDEIGFADFVFNIQ